MPYKNKLFAVVLFSLVFVFPARASAATRYISPVGSDTSDGSLSTPFKTIQKCINVAVAGDICQARTGTYPETVTIGRSGTSAQPIVLSNYPGEKPVIDGQLSRSTLLVNKASFITIDGLTLANSSSFGAKLDTCTDITIKNTEVSYSQDGGIVFLRGSNILVDSVNVHHTNQRSGADHEAVSFMTVNGFEIKNSQVHDGLEEGIDAKYNATNGKIHHNKVYANNGPNIYIDAANTIDIYNNDVYQSKGSTKANIGLAIESTYNPNAYLTYNINVYNNILREGTGGLSVWVENNTYKLNAIHIYNNLFYGNLSFGAVRMGSSTSLLTDFQVKNNIFVKNTKNFISPDTMTIDYNLFDTSPLGTNAKTATSIGFVDELNKNFHLTSTSPAIGAGTSLGVTTDYDGNARPQGTGVDLGPYEYLSGNVAAQPSVTPTPMPLLGDANASGNVDNTDYTIWLNSFLTKPVSSGVSLGDFDNNSIVDGIDYMIWVNNYKI